MNSLQLRFVGEAALTTAMESSLHGQRSLRSNFRGMITYVVFCRGYVLLVLSAFQFAGKTSKSSIDK